MSDGRDIPVTDGKAILIDYANMMSDYVGAGRGITPAEIEELIPEVKTVAADIDAKRNSGEWGFFNLPYDAAAADEVLRLAASLRDGCEDFIVLGTGGSALGGKALVSSLCHPLHNMLSASQRNGVPRIFFIDNIDPATFQSVLDYINPVKTIFNVVTKSGATPETISQFLIVREMLRKKLGRELSREQMIITTGEDNELRSLAVEEGYRVLGIPDNVAGRFSVFSPVGLFPAAMAGIDVMKLLEGARYADEHCRTDSLWENPAYLGGALHYLADTKKKLNTAVMMPYSDALIQVAYWFRQLWAESLGKAETISGKIVNTGQTPVVASGVTDQHSQLQLYTEGPFNKMITFLLVEKTDSGAEVPAAQGEEFSYLGGHKLGELMNIEARATRLALTEAGRSNMSIILPEISPFVIGQLLFMLEVQAVFAAGLYNVNPMDQPGVEAAKRHIPGMMGRKSFTDTAPGTGESRSGKRYTV